MAAVAAAAAVAVAVAAVATVATASVGLVRVKPRQPFIDRGPDGLLEGSRGQNLCPGQVEVPPLNRRVKASYTPNKLTWKVGKIAVR